ncbi:MAG: hypothetical protein ACP5PP_08915 [Fervidobacterium sp.]
MSKSVVVGDFMFRCSRFVEVKKFVNPIWKDYVETFWIGAHYSKQAKRYIEQHIDMLTHGVIDKEEDRISVYIEIRNWERLDEVFNYFKNIERTLRRKKSNSLVYYTISLTMVGSFSKLVCNLGTVKNQIEKGGARLC